ncbi:MAG: universal stress protein [Polyangiaceae bacterium]
MKRILVCLDGSPQGPGVLAAAVEAARAHDAELILFRSVGLPPEVPQDFWKTTEEPLLGVLERRADTYLAECAAKVPKGIQAESQVTVGVPWQAICDAARRTDADLIVIGSHGYGGLDRLLGTTAAKVVNHAPCSVVVAREPHPTTG